MMSASCVRPLAALIREVSDAGMLLEVKSFAVVVFELSSRNETDEQKHFCAVD